MAKKSTRSFTPYEKFKSSQKAIDEFRNLLDISLNLTQQLLFRHSKDEVKSFTLPLHKIDPEKVSYSMGDLDSVELSCEWITLRDYAERTKASLMEVQKQASQGAIGPIQKDPKTSKEIAIWPPEKQKLPMEKLPKPGGKSFKAKILMSAQVPMDEADDFEKTQKTFLRLAHSIGEPDQAADRAREVLCRSCFPLRWTQFEIFLRSSIHELFKKHPHMLASTSRAMKPTVSYANVVYLSERFTSINNLREALVEKEIERSETEGQSVHGLINFLKSSFGFMEDPYKVWYVRNGQRYETDYNTLVEIKDVRNALVHDGGKVSDEFMGRFPNVPYREGVIVIDDDYHLKSTFVLKSIAYKITRIILKGKYVSE